ncbi:MAG: hypothetical protein FJ138_19260, partial [Deltaproteobacteria bacterium]|nr:hypothetical protein [Deltaproteobacteria bacterium]
GAAFCGEPCGPAPGYACPPNAGCFDLQDGSSTCAPLTLACSDEAQAVAEEGEYCFGAAQCKAGLVCAVESNGATCVRTGAGAFGDRCAFNDFCASGLCLPFSDDHAECAEACDPRAPRCPQGAACVEVSDPSIRGLCVPPGRASDGDACDGAAARCAEGLECAQRTCVRFCEPYGACPEGFGCTPRSPRWRCEPLGAPGVGEACVDDACGGGLYCLRDRQRCLAPCDPAAPPGEGCGGRRCLALTGLGVCSPGAGEAGDPCADSFDCADLICLSPAEAGGGGGLCASPCAPEEVGAPASCPPGWACAAGAPPRCAPLPSGGAGGEGQGGASAGGASPGGASPGGAGPGGASPGGAGPGGASPGGASPGGASPAPSAGAPSPGEAPAAPTPRGGAACAQPAAPAAPAAPLPLAALAALALLLGRSTPRRAPRR